MNKEAMVFDMDAGDGVFCGNLVRRIVNTEVRDVDHAKRALTHIISTDSVDRAGDIVEPDGVNLSNYKRNPVVMVDHDYRTEKIVGRARKIEVHDGFIAAQTEFRDTPLAVESFKLAAEGLGGWSIGFRPLKRHYIKDGADGGCKRCQVTMERAASGRKPGASIPEGYGMHFTEWDLLEYSHVAIPANQDVVNDAIKRGLVEQERVNLFLRALPPATAAASVPNVVCAKHDPLAEPMTHVRRRLAAHAFASAVDNAIRRIRNNA